MSYPKEKEDHIMILNTHPNDRKEMVKAISELTGLEATYLYMPTCAYQIGAITVNRDGSISCDDEAVVETICPMLIDRGWFDAEQETEKSPANSEAPARVREIKITMPIEGWTVSQMANLLRMVYGKQRLINRMLDSEMLYVGEAIITTISENPPGTPEDFEAKVQTAIETGQLKGLDISAEKVSLSVPFVEDDPTRWTAYSDLLCGMLRTAGAATRVGIKQTDDPENEKYHANSWLMRMGFGGTDFKETRRVLMKHLNGYAAFRSAAEMEAHRERQTRRRLEIRKEAAHD